MTTELVAGDEPTDDEAILWPADAYPARWGMADVDRADSDGLLGLAARARQAGRIEIGPDATSHFEQRVLAAAMSATAIDSRAAAAVAAFDDAGIDHRLLKGVAVSRLDYPDRSDRPYGDADVLIPGDQIAAAVELLRERGFRRCYAEPFDDFDRLFGKGVAMVDEHGLEIDLHRTLALGWYGARLRVDDLWSDSVELTVVDQSARALVPSARFVHVAIHAALSPRPMLRNLVDVRQIGRSVADDPDRVIDTADRWGCGWPTAVAICTTVDALGPDSVPATLTNWARGRRQHAVERLADTAYRGRIASSHLRTASALAGTHGLRRRAAIASRYVRATRQQRQDARR